MELHRLPVDAIMRPDPVDTGWMQALHRGEPLTVDQVLGRGLQAMLDEDRAEAERADPIRYIRAQRARRTLWGRLLGRR